MNHKSAEQLMKDNLIVKHYAGSHAYGTAIETSDVDFRGIFVADPINIRTPFFPIKECDDVSEEDTKLYELNQYVKLAIECNPNIIETLWVDQQDIVLDTPAYQVLRSHREQLLCSKIAFTTSGYAISQLNRIKAHCKWINNPQPVDPPHQSQYISLLHNFTETKHLKFDISQYQTNHRLIPYGSDTYGIYSKSGYSLYNNTSGTLNSDYQGDSHALGTPLFIIKFNKETYNAAKDNWQHYWTWKTNRNKTRSALEEQFGYDCKHAMHAVRLLNMGAEALEFGHILVKRPDAQLLLDIRHGKWTYDQLIQYSTDMDNRIRTVLYPNTQLRKKPDVKLGASLIMQVQDLVWSK